MKFFAPFAAIVSALAFAAAAPLPIDVTPSPPAPERAAIRRVLGADYHLIEYGFQSGGARTPLSPDIIADYARRAALLSLSDANGIDEPEDTQPSQVDEPNISSSPDGVFW